MMLTALSYLLRPVRDFFAPIPDITGRLGAAVAGACGALDEERHERAIAESEDGAALLTALERARPLVAGQPVVRRGVDIDSGPLARRQRATDEDTLESEVR